MYRFPERLYESGCRTPDRTAAEPPVPVFATHAEGKATAFATHAEGRTTAWAARAPFSMRGRSFNPGPYAVFAGPLTFDGAPVRCGTDGCRPEAVRPGRPAVRRA